MFSWCAYHSHSHSLGPWRMKARIVPVLGLILPSSNDIALESAQASSNCSNVGKRGGTLMILGRVESGLSLPTTKRWLPTLFPTNCWKRLPLWGLDPKKGNFGPKDSRLNQLWCLSSLAMEKVYKLLFWQSLKLNMKAGLHVGSHLSASSFLDFAVLQLMVYIICE